ncbi:MAG: hypothetical protein KIS89_04865 [Dokdonella sp.]|uniref:trypsin-like serine peptidase n=1 Tax=Dokdonella sp. TaxID=2291710 RepID=UPI0027B9ACB7|nr:hypothetical protein [Dokdonella sp.]MCW5577952.1 hypothetical protein [Dokdonella sp.]
MTQPHAARCRLPRTALLALLLLTGAAAARQGEPPLSLRAVAKIGADVPLATVRGIDAAARAAEVDRTARASANRDKRLHVADLRETAFDTVHDGRWDRSDGLAVWRLRVQAPGATDLRVDFGRYELPRGARLYLIGADGYYQGPYTRADALAGSFHSSLLPGDTATIELQVPAALAEGHSSPLTITAVGAGFRDLFDRAKATGPGTSGACNINVACPLGQPYPAQIRAVGHYQFNSDADGRGYICTGTLLNNTAQNRKNYFLTAAHCVSTAAEAQSMVVYWNYQSTTCGTLTAPAGGYFNDDQHGANLRATREDVDFTLVEMSTTPEAGWNLHYAGWDVSGTAPSGTVGIHHPYGDVKKITAGPQPTTTDNCISNTYHANTHWLTGPYSQGTTEGGSSGSALFSSASSNTPRRAIGILSGGDAACSSSAPSQPNSGHDCYGKLAVAWTGTGTSSSNRLRDWLDPGNTGTQGIDGIDQGSTPPATGGDGHSRHAMPGDIGARIPWH